MEFNIKHIPKGKEYKDMPDMNYKIIRIDGTGFVPKLLPFSSASQMNHTIANLIPADAFMDRV